ncbi:WD repeat and SOCS box-containing protein 1 [Hypsibius exemplaris]|uniref:WD repeat and SOCS box-containing protein 1 n=1 Tax=Hypsibius exemplaris TaxID=2072580 RepID=A0A1W0XCJ0_HYPEX|nr:WD repeat and SOCS box-containing protein 1 [Hypsibius exemplaris]
MASFPDDLADSISEVRLLQELHTDVEFTCPRKHGDELVSTAWANDDSFFAWSLGTQKIFIVQTESDDAKLRSRPFDFIKKSHDTATVRLKKTLDSGGSTVTAIAFGQRSSDKKWHSNQVQYNRLQKFHQGSMVLAAGLWNGDIKIWDLQSSRIILVLQDHKLPITDLAFNGSLILASASKDTLVKLWDILDDGNLFDTLAEHTKSVNAVTWSPNGRRLVSVGVGKSVLVWDAQQGVLERRLEGHQNDVTGCQFSKGGTLLFTSSADTKVICWDAESGAIKATFEHMFPSPRPIFAGGVNGHEVRDVSVSADGVTIASICNDGFLRIWNIYDSKVPVAITRIPDHRVVSFSHNSYVLALGCRSGAVKFYESPMHITPLKNACRLVIRRSVKESQCSNLDLPRKIRAYLTYSDIH